MSVSGVSLGVKNVIGVVFLVEYEFRLEMLGYVSGNEHCEFSGVMVATEDGCQDCVERVLFTEEVCD